MLQIYKYCQCKNGTHKIGSSLNNDDKSDERHSYVVDCNRKEVHPYSTFIENQEKLPKEPKNEKPTHEDDMNSIWKIFDPNSANSIKYNQAYVCMFTIMFSTFLVL